MIKNLPLTIVGQGSFLYIVDSKDYIIAKINTNSITESTKTATLFAISPEMLRVLEALKDYVEILPDDIEKKILAIIKECVELKVIPKQKGRKMNPKYVILKDDTVFILNAVTSHDVILKITSADNIRSAGFFEIDLDGIVSAYGHSHSLNINSQPKQDSIYLEQTLRIGRF